MENYEHLSEEMNPFGKTKRCYGGLGHLFHESYLNRVGHIN